MSPVRTFDLMARPGRVAAGVRITRSARCPRRTGLGELHHPAPSLSHSRRGGIEVVDDPRAWQVRDDDLIEAIPGYAAALTASIQPREQ